MQPLVSIGMPVFNCERTLSTAIQSILNQTYANWELIIIDDGSKDKTLEIAKSFRDPRIEVINDGQNQRLPIRLNQAIALSRGKYFARMDGDDVKNSVEAISCGNMCPSVGGLSAPAPNLDGQIRLVSKVSIPT
jgi:glycosyltransferase involved in cell wall biosynthesis